MRSRDRRTCAVRKAFLTLIACALELEIERNMRRVALPVGHGKKTFARGKGKIVVSERVVAEIDLRGEVR